eukprot:gene6744-8067_t
MGGALADAAGVTRARKAVHFEPLAEEVVVVDDEGGGKRKKSKSKKKKKRHSSSSDSSSDMTDSDSSADRKARQRQKRKQGIPPPPSVTAKKVSVIEAKEISKLFRLKANWEALRLELLKFQVVGRPQDCNGIVED